MLALASFNINLDRILYLVHTMTRPSKYNGVGQWMDNDELMVARSDTMEWQGGRSCTGWSLIGKSDRDGCMQLCILNKVIDLIAEHVQPTALNVEVVVHVKIMECPILNS
jgi:hypothetical protein